MRYGVFIFSIILFSCGTETIEPPRPTIDHSGCLWVEGICIIDRNFRIDQDEFVWILDQTQKEVEVSYSGLDLFQLAIDEGLKVEYLWADSTNIRGTYSDRGTHIRIYLKRGPNVKPCMECMDRNFVLSHELLHFVAYRFLDFDYIDSDVHNVPHLFEHWAKINNMPIDETIEKRLYENIRLDCGYVCVGL